MIEAINFDESGLVPCVAQDARTGEVLTVAYLNAEALQITLKTREMHFWSRSRGAIWHKGETSGNVQRLVSMRYDCDGDALVALVEPSGPACHTGERSCFYRDLEGGASSAPDAPPVEGEPTPVTHEAIAALERTLAERRSAMPEGSYTAELLADPERAGGKISEEAAEVVAALATEGDERVAEEVADLLYHVEVGLISRDLDLGAALDVLNARRGR
jgi:phosphoribosyl-AMP cyclohydrolase / phosphoribosyl-ATP pyrophosphohydrolase